jgi:hypothetical protein
VGNRLFSFVTSRGGRVALLIIGLLIILTGVALRVRRGREAAFTEASVVVTARPPAEPVFPIELVIANEFQAMTNVQLNCTVDHFSTDSVDLLDTDVVSRDLVPTIAKSAQHRFQCQAPAELTPPFHLGDVRGAHVTLDVLFSVSDRWRRLGVRQGFDLVDDKSRGFFWQPLAPVLLR